MTLSRRVQRGGVTQLTSVTQPPVQPPFASRRGNAD